MFRKKITALLLLSTMIISLASCNTDNKNNDKNTSPQETTVQEPTVPEKGHIGTKGEYELATNISDGAILHAWCWSFNTIKENMEDIAKSGYTSIQTSPISECKVGENGGMQIQDTDESANNGKWYYHYQPIDYKIGNYQLGTKEEFTAMCDEADKYGISIIVDAVVNHMTSDVNAITENFFNNVSNPFHENGEITDYSDREQVTQYKMINLTDLNTQNPEVQQYVLKFLKECVDAGADGFRYDAMKHVELSDDDKAYASDFWKVVLDNGSKFQYGEILQGGADRGRFYIDQLDVSMTASKYGEKIRYAVLNKSLKPVYWNDYSVPLVEGDHLVTWVESHDNYCNDGNYMNMNDQNIKWAWSLICARDGGTPLFFSRPNGADTENQWGNNEIGKVGSDLFKDAEVVAVNKFRNHMAGLDETLTNPMDNEEVAMIERGDKGAVIVNVSDKDVKLKNAKTVLADGVYKDKVTANEFTVKSGKMNGTVKVGQIVTLY